MRILTCCVDISQHRSFITETCAKWVIFMSKDFFSPSFPFAVPRADAFHWKRCYSTRHLTTGDGMRNKLILSNAKSPQIDFERNDAITPPSGREPEWNLQTPAVCESERNNHGAARFRINYIRRWMSWLKFCPPLIVGSWEGISCLVHATTDRPKRGASLLVRPTSESFGWSVW